MHVMAGTCTLPWSGPGPACQPPPQHLQVSAKFDSAAAYDTGGGFLSEALKWLVPLARSPRCTGGHIGNFGGRWGGVAAQILVRLGAHTLDTHVPYL